jgi:hypothetical protein
VNPADLTKVDRIQACLHLTLEVQKSIESKDEDLAIESASALMSVAFEDVAAFAEPGEVEVRALVHEVITRLLVDLVFADDATGNFWETIVLPNEIGVMNAPTWISHIKWARLFGSTVPNTPDLSIDLWAHYPLKQQAKTLGRYCSTHDATSSLDVTNITKHLHPRLLPYFVTWITGTYLQSPGRIESEDETNNQRSALDQLLAFLEKRPDALASSLMEINTPFRLSYREEFPVKRAAEFINGEQTRQLVSKVWNSDSGQASQEIHNQLEGLAGHDTAIFCPNWRETHVAYRCLAEMASRMQSDGSPAIMVHPPNSPLSGRRADAWQDQSIEFSLPGASPLLYELGQVASAIRSKNLDFLFYPEVTPSNCTALMATQRMARVQAAGYGFPLTTGSPNMDYFIGGTEVEGSGEDYTEQLVLLPGLGVSTIIPPSSKVLRERPYDDECLRVVSLASDQKLNAPMLQAWEAILCDNPLALLDLFPGLTAQQAEQHSPKMARYLVKSCVDLHPKVERSVILDTLVDADLYLDSFPFGGFNSLVEVLVTGCPMVTLEGSAARQRFGAALLRRLDLPEFLIAKNTKEYIAAARRLTEDAALRMDIRAQIGDRERVLAALTDEDLPYHFAAAIEWMRNSGPLQHSARKGGAPIIITAGDKPRVLCA